MIGVALPYTPLARLLGFTHLPGPFFTFLAVSTATYLLLVELAKRLLFSRAST
jgi:Mg2+-importing ATPase